MAGEDRILLEEARAITEAARARGVRLRLLGALAIHLHSQEWEELARRLDRLRDAARRFTDLDFAPYGAERAEVRTLLEDGFGLARAFRHGGNSYGPEPASGGGTTELSSGR